MTRLELAKYIDHTLLKPTATSQEIEQFVQEALQYHFKSCCVNIANLEQVAALLRGSDVLPCVTAAFPFGAIPIATKVNEARDAVRLGAKEVDYVINIAKALEGDYAYLEREAKAITEAVHGEGAAVKAILELCFLSQEQKRGAAQAVQAMGVDYLKTSTGYGSGGATLEDVRLLREVAGPNGHVKASGGIRDYETAMRFIAAGADRIGASAGIKIVMGIAE